MRKTILLLIIGAITIIGSQTIHASNLTLSESAEITLLTASPGDELYSVFGHSAIRVYDPENGIDAVFNYGTFDFNTPNFYLKFIRGKLLYKLSVSRMEQFVPEYYLEGRAIYEQVLNLTEDEKQGVFDFLMINSLPENAYYHYDFFHDNCATRIRDLADNLLDISWANIDFLTPEILGLIRARLDYEFDYQPEAKSNRTFRDLLNPFLENKPWSKFGIDIALGLPADKIAHPFDYMYLPDEMLIAFALASFQDGSPLVSEHRIILRKELPLSPAGFFTPLKIMWLVFFFSLITLLSTKLTRFFDIAFFNVLGITGLVILFLWFLSDHITTKSNLNILWALPTHLYYIWKADFKHDSVMATTYFRFVTIIAAIMLLTWPWNPQAFNTAFFPLVLTVFVKSLLYSFHVPYLSAYLTSIRISPKRTIEQFYKA
jgi:hypothetical protein